MTWPTFQQLRYLVAIADAGTFGAAADEEFVTQPAISAQIKELERKLGVTLFERSSRGVFMTMQGSEVVERARVILRDMKDLVGSTHYEGDHLRGRIGLGVIPTLAPYVLPNVVRFIMSTHPKAELHIHELQTIHLLDSLRRGVIDLGLLALPVGSEEFTTESIGLDSFVLAMSESHPLAKEKSPVKLDV